MQGVKGGGDPPNPDASKLESEASNEMRKAGRDRAQAEDGQKQGVVETLQAHTSHIKDMAAEKMDKLGATAKNTVK